MLQTYMLEADNQYVKKSYDYLVRVLVNLKRCNPLAGSFVSQLEMEQEMFLAVNTVQNTPEQNHTSVLAASNASSDFLTGSAASQRSSTERGTAVFAATSGGRTSTLRASEPQQDSHGVNADQTSTYYFSEQDLGSDALNGHLLASLTSEDHLHVHAHDTDEWGLHSQAVDATSSRGTKRNRWMD